MALADVFFPGNKDRREDLAFLRAKLSLLLDKCCQGTNKLTGIIEKHLPGRKFETLKLDTSKDIRSNCDLIIKRMQEIQNYIDEHNVKLKQYLGTELFEKLVSIDTSFEKAIQYAKMGMLVSRCVFTLGAIIVPILIKKTNLFPALTQSLRLVSGFTIAGAILAVGFVIEVVGSIVIGAYERKCLNEAIDEYKEAISKLEPGAEAFNENIHRVWARIEIMSE